MALPFGLLCYISGVLPKSCFFSTGCMLDARSGSCLQSWQCYLSFIQPGFFPAYTISNATTAGKLVEGFALFLWFSRRTSGYVDFTQLAAALHPLSKAAPPRT